MKKIFTLIATAFMAVSAMATDFKDQLAISINGEAAPATEAEISINEETQEGKYTIMLKQFSFMGLLIGDVTMTGVQGDDDSNGFTNYATTQTATITNGDPNGIMGMLGGKIDVTVKEGSRSKGNKFYAMITLVVPGVGNVEAVFGDNNFDATSIDGINATNNKIAVVYTLGGQRVNSMVRGVNILKMQSGRTVKVFNKK